MTIKIALRLHDLDLRESEAYEGIHPDLTELSWEANGGVSFAVLYSDQPTAVAMCEAGDWARRIAKLMPGECVQEVYDELVSVSDIATRVGVAAEAVRLWAVGKRRVTARPFPRSRQVVGSGTGGKAMNLYAWREVVAWVRDVIGIDPDEGIDYLTDGQIANLNAELTDIVPATAWHSIQTHGLEAERVIADVQQLCAEVVDLDAARTRFHQIRHETEFSGHDLPLRIAFQ